MFLFVLLNLEWGLVKSQGQHPLTVAKKSVPTHGRVLSYWVLTREDRNFSVRYISH